MKWQERAHKILDDYQRGVGNRSFSIDTLAATLSVNRVTIWRNKEIYSRISKLRQSGALPDRDARTSPRRKTLAQDVRALRIERDQLKLQIEQHCDNYIQIYRWLREKNIDASQLMEPIINRYSDKKGQL